MTQVAVPVSVGELFDKQTILRIKSGSGNTTKVPCRASSAINATSPLGYERSLRVFMSTSSRMTPD